MIHVAVNDLSLVLEYFDRWIGYLSEEKSRVFKTFDIVKSRRS